MWEKSGKGVWWQSDCREVVRVSGVLARQCGFGGRWDFRSPLRSIWILNLNTEIYENSEEHSEYKRDGYTMC